MLTTYKKVVSIQLLVFYKCIKAMPIYMYWHGRVNQVNLKTYPRTYGIHDLPTLIFKKN